VDPRPERELSLPHELDSLEAAEMLFQLTDADR
jgi:hypothetical protein